MTFSFAPYNQDLAVEIIKNIAVTADAGVLGAIAQSLVMPSNDRNKWAIQFNNPRDFVEVLQNFVRLPRLDYRVEECLDRLGTIDPWEVLNFIEARLAEKRRRREQLPKDEYDAVTFSMGRAFQNIRSHPEYRNVLRRIRDGPHTLIL